MTLDQKDRAVAAGPQRSATRAWLVTLMLVLLAMINWADKAILGIVAPELMADLGLSESQYGLLASSIFFLFSLSAIGAGFIANRKTTKWILLFMVLLWSATQFTIWLAPTFVMILISRIILGLGEGPSAGISFHAATKWFRNEDRNLPIALQNVGSFGGIAVAAPGLTYIASQWGWRWAFFGVGIVGIIWAIGWLFIGKEGPFDGKQDTDQEESVPSQTTAFEASIRIPYKKLLLAKTFLGCVAVGLAAYWALSVLSAWVPSYLRSSQGYEAFAAAQIVMYVSLTAIFFLMTEAAATNYLMKRGVGSRIARGWMAAGSATVAGIFIILSTYAEPSLWQTISMCIGFGLGLVTFTTGAVMISEFVPVLQRGAVLGIYVAIITSAGVFAPIVFGWIVTSVGAAGAGYQVALLVSGCLVIAGGVLGLLLINPEKDAKRVLAYAQQI